MSIKKKYVPEFSSIFSTLYEAIKTPLVISFVLVGNAITLVSAYLFYLVEKDVNSRVETFFDAFWWAMVTISTVGYGDIYPITTIGRLIALFLIVVGVMFFISVTSILVNIIHSNYRK